MQPSQLTQEQPRRRLRGKTRPISPPMAPSQECPADSQDSLTSQSSDGRPEPYGCWDELYDVLRRPVLVDRHIPRELKTLWQGEFFRTFPGEFCGGFLGWFCGALLLGKTKENPPKNPQVDSNLNLPCPSFPLFSGLLKGKPLRPNPQNPWKTLRKEHFFFPGREKGT